MTAYIVMPNDLYKNEDGIYDGYMKLRSKLFNYTKPASITVPSSLDGDWFHIRNIAGLLKTKTDAERLMAEMKLGFPEWTFYIGTEEFPEGSTITWD